MPSHYLNHYWLIFNWNLGIILNESLIKIREFSIQKMYLKMSFAKRRLFVCRCNKTIKRISDIFLNYADIKKTPLVQRNNIAVWRSHVHVANVVKCSYTVYFIDNKDREPIWYKTDSFFIPILCIKFVWNIQASVRLVILVMPCVYSSF